MTDKRRTSPAPPTHQNLVQEEESSSRSFTFRSLGESAQLLALRLPTPIVELQTMVKTINKASHNLCLKLYLLIPPPSANQLTVHRLHLYFVA